MRTWKKIDDNRWLVTKGDTASIVTVPVTAPFLITVTPLNAV